MMITAHTPDRPAAGDPGSVSDDDDMVPCTLGPLVVPIEGIAVVGVIWNWAGALVASYTSSAPMS
jgi:hypothetical protein